MCTEAEDALLQEPTWTEGFTAEWLCAGWKGETTCLLLQKDEQKFDSSAEIDLAILSNIFITWIIHLCSSYKVKEYHSGSYSDVLVRLEAAYSSSIVV